MMKPGHVVTLVIGVLLAAVGLPLIGASAAVGVAAVAQGSGGYFATPTGRFDADSFAIVSEPFDVDAGDDVPADLRSGDLLSFVLRGNTVDRGEQIFLGIGPTEEVDAYLADSARSVVTFVRFAPFDVRYRAEPGTQPPEPPGEQQFWLESVEGSGSQQLEWDLRSGNWTLVVMNADGSGPISVDLQAGARSTLLTPIALGLLVGGIILLAIGIPLLVIGAAGLGGSATGRAAPYAEGNVVYPAHLVGRLDPNLTRWMWLVKWFLAIPHFIVLSVLWFAFFITTIIAGFAILFTGRYPRALFGFNVGVLRWNWRVAFYAYGALGTDRYPPFTLSRTDYPADFDVDYPDRLSNGLVLVKWWLLAIPHLLVVSAFTGTAAGWLGSGWWGEWRAGISLIGILVLIAAVILLFTGRYWQGLFDFVLGINRWIYRVIAYVALMRDEYPPFRLDQGPEEPQLVQGPAERPEPPGERPEPPADPSR